MGLYSPPSTGGGLTAGTNASTYDLSTALVEAGL